MAKELFEIPTAEELAAAIAGRAEAEEFGKRPDVIGAVVATGYTSGLVTTLDDGETTAGTKSFPCLLAPDAVRAGDKLVKIKVGSSYIVGRIGTPVSMVGESRMYYGAAAPSGWLLCNGTIGSASSGATSRANADTQQLFELLWNNSTNTQLAIQNSSGGATTRGASASADFTANKRLPLPTKTETLGVWIIRY